MTELTVDAPPQRPPRARPSSWTAIVVVSAALLLAAALLLGALWWTSQSTSSTSYTAQLPSTLLGIELEVAEGDVEIVGGASREVFVSRVDSSAFGHTPTEQRFVANGVLRLESGCPELVIGACASDYRLTVPDRVPLRIVAVHGDVRVTGYRGSGVLSTRDGSVTVDAYCGSILDVTAGSGSIDVRLTCAPQRLTMRTGSGDMTARVPLGQYSIDAETLDGDVTLEGLADDPAATPRIQALSNSGDVTLEAG
jgi:hypothetical protein